MTVQYSLVSNEDDEDGFINQLYELSNAVGIHFNRAEEPFEVALVDGEVVGGSVVSLSMDEVGFSVVIDPQHQGLGIGKTLIAHILSHAREMGAASVYADVVNDTVLRPYLAKLGFHEEEGRIMRKQLQETKTTMKKSELIKLIQESVSNALKEYDEGDKALQADVRLDQAVREADQLVDSLRALVKAMPRKQDFAMLSMFNKSLGGFVQKVATAVRTGKVQ
jgi:N-acetylglutamate synthase-like GNAT family acetyltransferase